MEITVRVEHLAAVVRSLQHLEQKIKKDLEDPDIQQKCADLNDHRMPFAIALANLSKIITEAADEEVMKEIIQLDQSDKEAVYQSTTALVCGSQIITEVMNIAWGAFVEAVHDYRHIIPHLQDARKALETHLPDEYKALGGAPVGATLQ